MTFVITITTIDETKADINENGDGELLNALEDAAVCESSPGLIVGVMSSGFIHPHVSVTKPCTILH